MEEELRRYFAIEARELVEGLTQGALQAERAGALPLEQRKHLLRLAHTLKGAARVVREATIADTAHAIEELLSRAGDSTDPAFGSRLLSLIDGITRTLPAEQPPAGAGPAMGGSPAHLAVGEEAFRAVRVDLSAIEGALEQVSAISGRCARLRDELGALAHTLPPGARHAASALDSLAAEIAQLRVDLYQMRLAPASTVFMAFERAVRDAAQASGVRVRFEGQGGDHRLDADVLSVIRDALIQLGRNAVAHGIEPSAARTTAGKPAEAIVSLSVERRGADVAFIVADDGRGLDLAALRQAVRRAGSADPDSIDALSEEALVERLLAGGLTSRRSVSQISGRGIGLDLVRATVARLSGRVSLRNRTGQGLAVELMVPVSLRSLSYVRVESDEGSALLPLDAVRATLRLAAASVSEVEGRPRLRSGDSELPLVALGTILSGTRAARDDARQVRPGGARDYVRDYARDGERVAALVAAGGELVAVSADRFGETGMTITQALPPLSGVAGTIRSIVVDEAGTVVPVLDPIAVLRLAKTIGLDRRHRQRRVPTLLVVDDSITSRMLEQSILETAGFEVHTAASAEEGLTRAAGTRYDLFIVDVEMPGMNGFDFVAATRADAALAATPAMLVTSRNADADRRRGIASGAQAYIVKGEFDQELFLNTVRRLVG